MALIVYAAGRLFVDAFRANTPLSANGYHIIQIAALVIVLGGGYMLSRMMTQDGEIEVASTS
jgi:prolipoprotein diacylglyceryltransferase